MTFHSIVRRWCRTYEPMQDCATNDNRRFYLTDSPAGVVELAKGIANKMSPCVVMESDVNGYVTGGLITRNYPLYFFVHARNMADGDAATEAKEEAFLHCQKFLSWLKKRHDDDMPMGDFGRIKMEDSIDIQTVGAVENGWFAVLVQIERVESLNLCEDDGDYIPDDDGTDG